MKREKNEKRFCGETPAGRDDRTEVAPKWKNRTDKAGVRKMMVEDKREIIKLSWLKGKKPEKSQR